MDQNKEVSIMNPIRKHRNTGFTLVEILIVVIILGILAAIVIPQFTNASQDARKNSLMSQLQTVRSQIELYKLQHKDALPDLATTNWAALTGKTDINGGTTGDLSYGPYLQQVPVNSLNDDTAVATGDGTAAPSAGNGWVYDYGTSTAPGTGKFWATGNSDTAYFNEPDPSSSADLTAAP
jgi:type II secretion system protein G